MTAPAAGRWFVLVLLALLSSAATSLHAQAWVLDPAAAPSIYNEVPALLPASFSPLADGRILAYGKFSHAEGRAVAGLALLRSNGAVEPTFSSELSTADLVVSAAPLNDGRWIVLVWNEPPKAIPDGLVVASSPTTTSSASTSLSYRHSLHRLRPDGSRDPSFTPIIVDAWARLVSLTDGRIAVWGSFRRIGDAPRNGLARLNTDGSLDSSYVPALAPSAASVFGAAAGPDGTLLASGFSLNANSTRIDFLVRVTKDGTVDPRFAPARLDGPFEHLVVQSDGAVLAGTQNRKLVRFSPTGAIDSRFSLRIPSASAGIYRIASLPGSRLAVEQSYARPTGHVLTGVFVVGPEGELERDFQSDPALIISHRLLGAFPDGRVLMLRQAATLSVGLGDPISATNPAVASAIAATASSAAAVGTIIPTIPTVDYAEPNLVVAAFEGTGVTALPFNPTARTPAHITRLESDQRGRVYAQGSFTHVDGQPRRGFARFLANGTFDPTFTPPYGTLLRLLPDGRAIMGESRIFRLRDDGSVDSSFALPSTFSALNTHVLATAPDGRLLVSHLESGNSSNEANLKLIWFAADGSLERTLPTRFGDVGYWSMTAYLALPPNFTPVGAAGSATAVGTVSASAGSVSSTAPAVGVTPVQGGVDPSPTNGGSVDIYSGTGLRYTVYNAIYSAQLLPEGRIVVAGRFSSAGGQSRPGVAWLESDGTVVPFAPPPPSSPPSDETTPVTFAAGVATSIYSSYYSPSPLLLADGSALILENQSSSWAPRLNARQLRDDGTYVAQFAPPTGTITIAARALSDGTLFSNGRRLFASASPDPNFAPALRFDGTPVIAATATLSASGHLWITGYFDRVDGQPRTSLARYESREIVGFTFPPSSQTLVAGRTATFTPVLGTNQPASYRWTFNGTTLPTATGATLVIPDTTAATAGDYRAIVTIGGQTFTSSPATLTVVANTTRLVNFSARSSVSPAAPQVAGLVCAVTTPRPTLLRAVGNGLRPLFGSGTALLTSPALTLYDGAGGVIAQDRGNAQSTAITALARTVGAFPLINSSSFPAGTTLGSALAPSLGAGSFTAATTSGDGRSGLSLFEFYDTGTDSAPPLVRNLSIRGQTGPGAATLTAGFVLSGNGPRRILIRGLGPALGDFGVAEAVADPQLDLSADGVTLAANTGWANAPALAAAARTVGAFPLPASSRDTAVVLTLEPGAYTAQLSSASGATGAAMIEIYVVDN